MRLDEVKYSLEHIGGKKLRSFLTVLSIVIGIMAIFALISFGLGISAYTKQLAMESGGDKLFIQPKGLGISSDFYVSKDDLDFVEKIKGVKDVSGLYGKTAEIRHGKEVRFADMMGYDARKSDFVLETMTFKIDKGRVLKTGETAKAVLGHNYLEEKKVFEKPLHLGDTILLNDMPFEVVGFFKEIGNPSDDSNVYISFESIEMLYPDAKDKYTAAYIRAEPGYLPKELADKITEKLRKHKGLDKGKEDFYVQTFEDVLSTFGTIINVINGILVLIAMISVIVASINIMNTMYTAVLERTKEIGIMKAIGARNEDILGIFIFESGFLGIVGGLVGIFLGYLVAKFGEAVAASSGLSMLKPLFPWYLILGCLLFSFAVGAGSGVLPARQASLQKPVDSLRYE